MADVYARTAEVNSGCFVREAKYFWRATGGVGT